MVLERIELWEDVVIAVIGFVSSLALSDSLSVSFFSSFFVSNG